ncbi:MAG: glycogen/starch synthase [Muribaculaceae bacterium]|nr:glycogen/starch synthase [Muribaculaceae bacterium]MBR5744431.1 glycogen/starch synthase [Muribaculaceae bacterium]
MDIERILYISQQISPYLPENRMSVFNRALPQSIQEKGIEVRIFMPKYGLINERRNQLHEVIRLSGMNVVIDDADHPLLIKVATLQPGRMQVYFIDNEDYFQRHSIPGLETDVYPEENDERIIFFTRSVIETVKKLRWTPAVIHCSGWISSLIPLYLRTLYKNDPAFAGIKIVFSIMRDHFRGNLNERMVDKLIADGVDEADLKLADTRLIGHADLYRIAFDYSDAICKPFSDATDTLVDLAKATGKPFLAGCTSENFQQKFYDFYHSLV